MSDALPQHYFRVRENGAMVFRVSAENRMRRIEMDQIAVVNIRNGEIKSHGDAHLTDEDSQAIEEWLHERRSLMAKRQIDDILRTIDQLNLTTAWAQQKAAPEELEAVAEGLLLAMHDLRSVLVRKRSDHMRKDGAG